MPINRDFLVEKRNVLNEIRANNMTLQELRFFSIYLSKINPRDLGTRVVRFSLRDFQKIMEFGSRVNIDYMKHVTNSLLAKVVNVNLDRGGYVGFQLFKECTVSLDEQDEWFVEIDASDKALPLMFEFKERYFTYELWNALKLKSSNQLRMYEILKQYENLGERTISVVELKALLGIEPNEYSRFGDLKVRVLDACQQALKEYTDIQYTYEPSGRRGKGGKILNIKFYITRNQEYTDQLSLEEFINQQETVTLEKIEQEPDHEQSEFMAEACGNEFNDAEIQVLYNLIIKVIPYKMTWNTMKERYDYLKRKYDEMKWRSERGKVSNRFGYLKVLIEKDMDIYDEKY